jgi:hypothetical protein
VVFENSKTPDSWRKQRINTYSPKAGTQQFNNPALHQPIFSFSIFHSSAKEQEFAFFGIVGEMAEE